MSAFEYKNSDFQNGFSSDIAGFIEKPVSLHKLNEMVLYLRSKDFAFFQFK
jgi:hypothetical protein